MRSCMYCGKTLEKNEKCMCPQSVKARKTKKASKKEKNYSNSDNVYTTGYTKREKKKFKWQKNRRNYNDMVSAVKSFIRDPVNDMVSPMRLSPVQSMLLILIESFVIAISFMLSTFRTIEKVFDAFSDGIAGFVISEHNIADFLVLTGLGTLIVIIGIFIFIGVFWLIDRLIIKRKTSFFDFAQRLIYAILFSAVFSVIGIVVGVFTVYASLIFNCLGTVAWLILTYKALSCEWNFLGASRVLYMMLAGAFILLLIMLNLFII